MRAAWLADTNVLSETARPQPSPAVLPFDARAARLAATMKRTARRRGHPIPERDLFIAATAGAHDLGVATRDVADFRGFGVPLYDPFGDVHAPA